MMKAGKILVPPPELLNVGDGDYVAVGDVFLPCFVRLGGLQPDHKVLDVGCGVGRMARPLTGYLSAAGAYEGFDVVASEVEWCEANITPKFPQFRFRWANVYNSVYNPDGELAPVDYDFPYENESFDFVFLTSVFTHMVPIDLEHYLAEIARVLKPTGRSFVTFFLLNRDSTRLVDNGRSALKFEFDCGIYRTTNRTNPEHAVAYDEGVILALYSKHGLILEPPIHYGSWCGRTEFVSYQDIVVAQKKAPAGGAEGS